MQMITNNMLALNKPHVAVNGALILLLTELVNDISKGQGSSKN